MNINIKPPERRWPTKGKNNNNFLPWSDKGPKNNNISCFDKKNFYVNCIQIKKSLLKYQKYDLTSF